MVRLLALEPVRNYTGTGLPGFLAYFNREGKVGAVGPASAAFVLTTCFYLWLLITIKYRAYCPRWIRLALAGLGAAAAGFLLLD